jgi:penicillin V acylase-like amidase (Ntn superfamily)
MIHRRSTSCGRAHHRCSSGGDATGTSQRLQKIAAVFAIFVALSASGARACNEVVLKDNCYDTKPVVSARTLSFPTAMTPEVAWVRKGGQLTYLDVAVNTPPPRGRAQPSKYDFVCVAHVRPAMEMMYPADAVARDPTMLICSDGINSQGLSAALLYEFETTGAFLVRGVLWWCSVVLLFLISPFKPFT